MTAYPAIFYRDPIYAAMQHEAEELQQKLSYRIENWVRVARDRKWESARCSSIESRYIPPASKKDEEREPKWTPDILDAWQLEDAWRSIDYDQHRMILVYVYHRGWKEGRVCRELPKRIRQYKFDETLRKARAALRNILERDAHKWRT